MVPSQEQLDALRERFDAAVANNPDAVAGATFREFYCPIMHEDGTGTRGLMEGHIVPEKVKSVCEAVVIQRADVDNYFGQTVEPNMIDWVNLHKLSHRQVQ